MLREGGFSRRSNQDFYNLLVVSFQFLSPVNCAKVEPCLKVGSRAKATPSPGTLSSFLGRYIEDIAISSINVEIVRLYYAFLIFYLFVYSLIASFKLQSAILSFPLKNAGRSSPDKELLSQPSEIFGWIWQKNSNNRHSYEFSSHVQTPKEGPDLCSCGRVALLEATTYLRSTVSTLQ